MIYEKWGAYGNAERRTQHWKQQVTPVGDSMPDLWQYIEISKRFNLKMFGEQKIFQDWMADYRMYWIKPMRWVITLMILCLMFFLPMMMPNHIAWPDPIGEGIQ